MMTYSCPDTLDQALALIGADQAIVLAGGTDLYAAPTPPGQSTALVDISALGELRGIQPDGKRLRFGALTTWSDIVRAKLPPAFFALQQAARQVGGVQIQNAATIAGNLCNASPAADGIPPLLILDAEVELASSRGTRRLPLASFVTGPRETARAPDELVTAIHVPRCPADSRSAFEKLGARKYLVISIAMAAALVRLDRQGRIAEARVAIGAASPVARRLPDLEDALVGQNPNSADIALEHLSLLAPIDDIRASADYRLDAAAEICRRAIRSAGARDG